MKNLKYGIGIDVAKANLDVCLSVISEDQKVKIIASRKFENNLTSIKAFEAWASKHCKESLPVVFLMEATGIYYEQLAWYLFDRGKTVVVVLPNKAKKYKESLGLRSKTDAIDAKGLAQMSCEQHFKPWQPISKNIYQIRLLTRQIERLNRAITQFKNQLSTLSFGMYRDKTIEKMMDKNITLLEKQKSELEEKIRDIVEKDAILKKQFENICKIKGLGICSLAVIVAETNGFALMENQSQLVSYAGYDVIENSSGTRIGKTKISKKGNGHIRKALHMPALNMVRYKQSPFVQLYDRVYSRTNIKMKGYTAIQKKLLVIIYTLWKRGDAYNPSFINTSFDVKRELSFV